MRFFFVLFINKAHLIALTVFMWRKIFYNKSAAWILTKVDANFVVVTEIIPLWSHLKIDPKFVTHGSEWRTGDFSTISKKDTEGNLSHLPKS